MSKLDVLKENGTYNPRHEKVGIGAVWDFQGIHLQKQSGI